MLVNQDRPSQKLKIKYLSPMCSRLLCDVYVDIMLVKFKANKGLKILVVIQSWVSASQKAVKPLS